MPTNREVIELIHQGLPPVPNSRPDAPDKKEVGRAFGKMIGQFSDIEKDPLFQLSTEEIGDVQNIVEQARSIRSLIAGIRKFINKPLEQMALNFFREQVKKIYADEKMRLSFKTMIERHWGRYQTVRAPGALKIREENPDTTEEDLALIAYTEVVFGGIHNVLYHDIASLLCIPQVIQKTEKATVKEDRWKIIGNSTLPMLQEISHAQDHVFIGGISPAMRDKDATPIPEDATNEDLFDWPAFDPWAFRIDENNIGLHPRIIRPTRKKLAHLIRRGEIESDGDRIGCAGLPTFSTIHKRVMMIADQAIFPHAEKVLSLPQE